MAFALWVFVLPGLTVIHELGDSNIRSGGIPKFAWKLHRALSPQYERWAKGRLESGRAATLSTEDISGTEWPLFGTAFYMWATESLQSAWEQDHTLSPVSPTIYARGAIEAAASLVTDPAQANWVKIHWGKDYLHTENVFYRMLVISVLTSHARLTGERQWLPVLKDQADSLAAELDASPHGLLDDYPGQCYPGDVLTAVAMIRKADGVLGSDHSEFTARAIRGFQGAALDVRGLVPYFANAKTGTPDDSTRGCDNSYVGLFAPSIWPEQSQKWYDLYTKYFWQETGGCAGFREYPRDLPQGNRCADVDSGPVLGGYGCAACAFGVGAARANGHFEQAYPLAAEMLVSSWPLPNGACLVPRLLSDAADAPFLGESAILFNLTRMPPPGYDIKTGGSLPRFVIIFLAVQLGIGLLLLMASVGSLFSLRRAGAMAVVAYPRFQFWLWTSLLLCGWVSYLNGWTAAALILAGSAQFFPRRRAVKSSQSAVRSS